MRFCGYCKSSLTLGLCPNCDKEGSELESLRTELAELREKCEGLEQALLATKWALLKVFDFVPTMFKTGWTDEVQAAIEAAREEAM